MERSSSSGASEDESRYAVGSVLYVDGVPATITLSRRVGRGRPAIRLDRPVERGAILTIPRAALPALPEGEFYNFEIIGLRVEEEGGRSFGVVRDVLPGPANDNLELDDGTLVPMIEDAIAGDRHGERRRASQPGLHQLTDTLARMRLDVFTQVPHAFGWLTEQKPLATVLGTELELRLFNYRDTTPLRAGQVDDSPYGGGAGMVLRVDVVAAALEAAYGDARPARVIALTPQGRQLDQALVEELVAEPSLAVLSSRFEGFDARIVDHLCTDAISIGPYVLSGGELPAMVLLDAIARRLPGALAEGSGENESFSAALDGRPRVSALHAPGGVLRLGGARRAPLREPRPDRRLAGRAEPRAEHCVSDVDDRPEDSGQPPSTVGRTRTLPSRATSCAGARRGACHARPAYGAPALGAELAPRAAALPPAGRHRRRSRRCRRDDDLGWPTPPTEPQYPFPYTPPGQRCPASRAAPGAALAQPGRPADPRPARLVAGDDRLDRHDRRRGRDRAARQGLRRQPVPHPVVVDGADAALRPARDRL